MSKRTPPFNALHAFVVTARHLNLTRAADELCVTQGAVSRQIATLEAYLGFSLFQRHARGYTPTEAGEEVLRTAGLMVKVLPAAVPVQVPPKASSSFFRITE